MGLSPLISVVIPTYNGARYLVDCLDSVSAQTFRDFEVVIADDRSDDATVEIARKYAANDSRIRVVESSSRLGLASNWNRGFSLSRGVWVKFLFQDDWMDPPCLEELLKAGTDDVDIICCQRRFRVEEGTSRERAEQYARYLHYVSMDRTFNGDTKIPPEKFCAALMRWNGTTNFVGEPTAVLLRKSALTRFGNFNPHLVQHCDIEYWARIGTHSGISYVPKALVWFRVHMEAATVKNFEELGDFRARLLDLVIMYHDLAFQPVYARLRDYCQASGIDLNELLSRACREVDTFLGTVSGTARHEQAVSQWGEIQRQYPLLARNRREAVSSARSRPLASDYCALSTEPERLDPTLLNDRDFLGGLMGLNFARGAKTAIGWLNVGESRLRFPSGRKSEPNSLYRIGPHVLYFQYERGSLLSLPPESIQWIFAEHFLERLTREEAQSWLRQMRSLLRPGGTLRLSTPDLGHYVERYATRDGPGRARMVNEIFRHEERQWVYDQDELFDLAGAAGFTSDEIARQRHGVGRGAALAHLDSSSLGEESLYIELWKKNGQ